MTVTVNGSHLLAGSAVVVALLVGLFAGRSLGRRETIAAVRAQIEAAKAKAGEGAVSTAPRPKKKQKPPGYPELLISYKDGKVVKRELRDPVTGTVTALPLDGPDPRPPIQEE